MSTTTPNLGLFKYNPETDGKETFSISQALNANWDIIDNTLTSSSSLGQSGYIKFNNGLTINYGQASVGTQEVAWDQSQYYLASNGTLGGSTCACYASSVPSSGQVYHLFDGSTTTAYASASIGSSEYIIFYSPIPIKPSSISILPSTYGQQGVSVAGSNDNISYTTIGSIGSFPSGSTWATDTMTSDNFYRYIKFTFNPGNGIRVQAKEVAITATYLTSIVNTITFPCAFTTTNYAYSLAYRNGIFGESYATTLTNTGMTLQNNSNADAVYYIAVGY